jgi:hypothetical protein
VGIGTDAFDDATSSRTLITEACTSQRVCETLDAETHQLHPPPVLSRSLLPSTSKTEASIPSTKPRLVHVTSTPQTAKSDVRKPVLFSGLRRLLLGNPALGPARDGSGGLLLVHRHRPGVPLRRLLPIGRPAPGATGSSRGGSSFCGAFVWSFLFLFCLFFFVFFFPPSSSSSLLAHSLEPGLVFATFCLLRVTLRLAQTGPLVGSTFFCSIFVSTCLLT